MNCPSKTDDAALEHPTWNQNPPDLAADLTTRQDLNGLVNSRIIRNSSGIGDDINGAHNEELDSNIISSDPGGDEKLKGNLQRFPFLKTAASTDNHARRLPPGQTSSTSRLRDWIVWAASVLICSFLLSKLQTSQFFGSLAGTDEVKPADNKTTTTSTATLHVRATCPGAAGRNEDYNKALHIGAIFIILAVSGGACSFPLIAKRFPKFRIPPLFFFMVRHFGSGVLIATAFVHLLPTAFILLGDPCLSDFWVTDYPAMPGAIALAGVFFVIIIEMIFHPSRHMQTASLPENMQLDGLSIAVPAFDSTSGVREPGSSNRETEASLGEIGGVLSPRPNRGDADVEKASTNHSFSLVMTKEQRLQKDVLQCLLLEMGILFHSVFIGMALSVSIGNEFVVLLIAISFHQTFEGLALGSRIANIDWPEETLQPWFMALAYGCTTPVGQAIGIATSSLYSPDSETGLILVGTMNAISSGLLVFASLVELLGEDFLSHESWQILRGKRRAWASLLVFLGAFCMSLVGAWA